MEKFTIRVLEEETTNAINGELKSSKHQHFVYIKHGEDFYIFP